MDAPPPRKLLAVSISAPVSLGSLIKQSGTTTYVLGILYALVLVYTFRRFVRLWTGGCGSRRVHRAWDTPMLFVASIVFAAAVRTLSFMTLAILLFAGNNGSAADNQFFELVLAVLFNVGDWACISTYTLLIIVWVEMLQQAVKHFYSSTRSRRHWMVAYLVVNTVMYVAQIGLYVSLFTAKTDPQVILNAIYAVIAFLNLALPVVLLVTWVVYSCMFAGFPYRSTRSREAWLQISKLLIAWTLGRIVWAVIAVLAASQSLVNAISEKGDWLFTVVMVTVFVVAELLPYLSSLGTDILTHFTPQDQSMSEGDGGVQPASTGIPAGAGGVDAEAGAGDARTSATDNIADAIAAELDDLLDVTSRDVNTPAGLQPLISTSSSAIDGGHTLRTEPSRLPSSAKISRATLATAGTALSRSDASLNGRAVAPAFPPARPTPPSSSASSILRVGSSASGGMSHTPDRSAAGIANGGRTRTGSGLQDGHTFATPITDSASRHRRVFSPPSAAQQAQEEIPELF